MRKKAFICIVFLCLLIVQRVWLGWPVAMVWALAWIWKTELKFNAVPTLFLAGLVYDLLLGGMLGVSSIVLLIGSLGFFFFQSKLEQQDGVIIVVVSMVLLMMLEFLQGGETAWWVLLVLSVVTYVIAWLVQQSEGLSSGIKIEFGR